LGNKLFTFLHIEQKAAAGLGYTMAPENALTNCQMLQGKWYLTLFIF
jgi:hypothetical protein